MGADRNTHASILQQSRIGSVIGSQSYDNTLFKILVGQGSSVFVLVNSGMAWHAVGHYFVGFVYALQIKHAFQCCFR